MLQNRDITVGGNTQEIISGNFDLDITQNYNETVNNNKIVHKR